MSPPPTYFPLRWESTGDQWWYASPIDWAAANGHYDLVRELLRLDGNHLIKLTSLRRVRRLETVWDDDEQFSAVAEHRSAVAKSLLAECDAKKGKNSLIGAGYGGWLLYTAASAGDLDFVRELLNERDPLLVFGEGEYGVTDILYAAARSRNSEVFKVVLDFATVPRFSTAAAEGQSGEVPDAYKAEIMNRAIHAAARGGNMKLLRELVGGGSVDILAYRDVQGATVLHAAAARGQVEVVRDLISSSDMIAATDNLGNTALHVAAHRGHLPVVEALIVASPSLIIATNNAGETFLHAVIAGFQTPGFRRLDRQISLMKHLLSGEFFNTEDVINIRDSSGRTALHHAIMGNIHSDLVELLMTVRSIDVNIRDADGMTPLDILKRRPHSASSDLLTKQLISAGGIFTSEEEYYSARRAIASHIKRQSMGGSPGTSFRISDVEILLHTGMENASSDGCGRSRGRSPCSPDPGAHRDSGNRSPRKKAPKPGSISYLKRLLNWPGMKSRTSDRLKRVVEGSSGSALEAVPLRQRFSKPSSPSSAAAITCNKRTRSGRSDAPNPAAQKKLASGVVQGVMQAVPKHRSRSNSFSKLSWSSHSSLDAQKGGQIDSEMAKASCSSAAAAVNNDGRRSTLHRHSFVNQYLCFGGAGQHVEGAGGGEIQPYDVYERSVLSAA